MKKVYGRLFTATTKDWIKGLWTAITGAILGAILPTLQHWFTSTDWNFVFDWQAVLKLGVGAGLAYVFRKTLTNSDDKFLQKEPKLYSAEGPGGSTNPPPVGLPTNPPK